MYFPHSEPRIFHHLSMAFLEAKVLNFLDVAGYWDPSLAFVMGCGILVSFPAFYLADRETTWPWWLCKKDGNSDFIWYIVYL